MNTQDILKSNQEIYVQNKKLKEAMDQAQQALQSDHDILLGLAKTVELQHVETMGKIADVKSDVKNIVDGTSAQISNHETRLQILERSREQLSALKITDIAIENNKEIMRLKNYWKAIAGLIALLAGVIIWLLNVINGYVRIGK